MKAVTPTPEQRAALETTGVSIHLSAGAGSGKTSVLTRRFLGYLRPDSAATLSSVVAITFTDRAAREMRDRVRLECRRLADFDRDHADHWQNVLRGLDAARISTIHGFCTTILRAWSVEADLDPEFSLLEPTAAPAFLRQAVRDVLFERLCDGDADTEHLLLRLGPEETARRIGQLVKDRFRDPDRFQSPVSADELTAQWSIAFFDHFLPQRFRDAFAGTAAQTLRALLAEAGPGGGKAGASRLTLQQLLTPLAESASWPEMAARLEGILPLLNFIKLGAAKTWPSPEFYQQVQRAVEPLKADFKHLDELRHITHENVQFDAQIAAAAWRVALASAERYDALKRGQGAIDFDDLLLLTQRLLKTRPDIRRHVATGIDFLLVDEFQDTDPLQAEIVSLLCGDELASGKLFMVGDSKQSIYRFRRAEPRLFAEFRQRIPAAGQLSLTTNFRSRPAILQFVNAIFGRVMEADYEPLQVPESLTGSASAQPGSASAQQGTAAPRIEFLFADRSRDPDDVPPDTVAMDLAVAWEADWMAARITQLLSPPVAVDGETAPYAPGDIAILFRTLTALAAYETALHRHGIPYYVVKGKAFFSQPEVHDLANLLRALDEPDDTIALAGLLRSPVFNVSDEGLLWLRAHSERGILAALDRINQAADSSEPVQVDLPPQTLSPGTWGQLRFASRTLRELRGRRHELPLHELIDLAIELTGYDACLSQEFLGERRLANVLKLRDLAQEFATGRQLGLAEFLTEIDEMIAVEEHEPLATTAAEGGQTVRLMTIHQSKGLEFPVVFLAGLARQPKAPATGAAFHPELGPIVRVTDPGHPQRPSPALTMWQHEESLADEAERHRLLYVAMTRAKERLILAAGIPTKRAANTWLALLGQYFDPQTGLPRHDPLLGTSVFAGIPPHALPDVAVHLHPPASRDLQTGHSQRRLSCLQQLELIAQTSFEDAPASAPPPRWQTTPLADPLELTVTQLDADAHQAEVPDFLGVSDLQDLPPSSATDLGTLVHLVLQYTPFDQPDSWRTRVPGLARLLRLSDRDAIVAAATARLEPFFESPWVARLASARQLLRELPLLLPLTVAGRRLIIRGTMDCLAEDQDGQWLLMDYKTSRLPPDPAVLQQHYQGQLTAYVKGFREVFQRLPDELTIMLLHPRVMSPVRIPLSPAIFRDWEERLQAQLRSIVAAGGPPGLMSVEQFPAGSLS